MERMIEILKYLKGKTYFMPSGNNDVCMTKEEISNLCELGILYGYMRETDSFYVSSRKRTNKMMEILLDSKKEITKHELNVVFGISDYHIRKLLDDGKLILVKRGVYQSNVVKVEMESTALPQNLTVTEEMMKAIDENNLPEVLNLLEETEKNEFIELSRNLWKWVMTQILGNESIKAETPKQEQIEQCPKESEVFDDISILEEETQKQESSVVSIETEELQVELSSEESEEENFSSTTTTESSDDVLELELDHMDYIPTGLPLEELYRLYLKNRYNDPSLAKEFLLEYKDQCEERNIPFDYLQLKKINRLVEDFNISSDQLAKERELKLRIKHFLKRELNLNELKDLEEALNQFDDLYQDRGVQSILYGGDYQAKIGNYSEALKIYNSLLQKEPWNTTIYHKISSVFLKMGSVEKLIHTLETSLHYVPYDDYWRAQLAFAYIEKEKFSKMRELVASDRFKNFSQYGLCIRAIIKRLSTQIYQYEKYLSSNISFTYSKKIKNKMDVIILELEYYQELYSQLKDYSDLDEEMMTGNYFLKEYEDEVYNVTIDSETLNICPRRLEEYVENFQTSIPMDEELLLYIAAAKIMFTHKWSKHGEHYLKLVRQVHSSNPAIQREYQQLIKNKKLYLNK